MSNHEATARSVVEAIQGALDETIGTHRPEPLMRLFDEPSAVLIGTSAYRAGTTAVRGYFSALGAAATALQWHLHRYDVFLDEDDLIGFGAEGEVEWSVDEQSGRDPFRLTVIARRHGQSWSVLHFHGSVPEQ